MFRKDCNITTLIAKSSRVMIWLHRVKWVNYDPVTPEFNRVKGVHPLVSFFKINLSDKLSQNPLDRSYQIFTMW